MLILQPMKSSPGFVGYFLIRANTLEISVYITLSIENEMRLLLSPTFPLKNLFHTKTCIPIATKCPFVAHTIFPLTY
jgi:hypothetical protein